MTNSLNISIIIFSHDRQALLERSFNYYASSPYPVIAVDSSLRPFNGHVPDAIQYIHKPGEKIGDKIYAALKLVKTPYSVLSADDDFLSFEGLQSGFNFLRNRPDYNSVQGHYVHFEQCNPNDYLWPSYLPTIGHKNNSNDPKKRMRKAFCSQHLYALFRTKDLTVCFRSIIGLNVVTNIELCTSIVGDILGKHKVIPKFWMARSIERFSSYTEDLPTHPQVSNTIIKRLNRGYLDHSDGNDLVRGVTIAIKDRGYSSHQVYELMSVALESYEKMVSAARKESISKKFRKLIKSILPSGIEKQLRKVSARGFRKKVQDTKGFPWSDEQANKEWLKMVETINKYQAKLASFVVSVK